MAKAVDEMSELGVYATDADGNMRLVHRYQGGDYGIEEIIEYFRIGKVESTEQKEETTLILESKELRELKTMADVHSFDHEEGFIEMCLEIHRFATKALGKEFRFTANF
ncbi:MAG: hypothetical protein ACE5K1_02160 [Acidiferrobacterales bacterium]